MTVTIVQHVIGTTNGATPYTLTIPSTAAGNVGCGFIYGGISATGWSVTDNAGSPNTYTINTSTPGEDTTDGVFIFPFYKVGINSGATILTVNRTGGDNVSACWIELHSTTGWTGFRNFANGSNNAPAASLVCSGSLGAAGDAIVAGCWINLDELVSANDGHLATLDTNANPSSVGIIAGDSDQLLATVAVTPSFNCGGTNAQGAIAAMAFTPGGGTPFYYQYLESIARPAAMLNNRRFAAISGGERFEIEPLGQTHGWVNRGWELQEHQPPSPVPRVAREAGVIAASGLQFEIEPLGQTEGRWQNRGWELQEYQPQSPYQKLNKNAAIMPIAPGNEAKFIPSTFVPIGWEPVLHQPQSASLRSARGMAGASISGERFESQVPPVQGVNAGWEPTLPQPHRFQQQLAQKAAIPPQDDSILKGTITRLFYGWDIQPFQPSPIPRRPDLGSGVVGGPEDLGWGQVGPILIVTPTAPTIPNTTPLGATVATITVLNWNGAPFTGWLGFGPPGFDDGGIYAITGAVSPFSLVVNPGGPGVGAQGGNIDNVNILANDLGVPSGWEPTPQYQSPLSSRLRLRGQAIAIEPEHITSTARFVGAGWEVQHLQPPLSLQPHDRFAAIAPSEDGTEAKYVFVSPNTIVASGLGYMADFQPPIPLQPHDRFAAIAPYDDGIEGTLIVPAVIRFGWEPVLHQPQPASMRINRIGAMMPRDEGTQATLIPGVSGPITSFPISAGPITGGIFVPGPVFFPVYGWDQEPFPLYLSPASRVNRAGIALVPAGEHPLDIYHRFFAPGWEIQPPQPPAKPRRVASVIIPTGEQPMDIFHLLVPPFGWEIQPPPPPNPSQPRDRFASIAPYEDGIENKYLFVAPNSVTGTGGWFMQDFQPSKFPGRAAMMAGMMPSDDGIAGLFLALSFVPFGWEAQLPHLPPLVRRRIMTELAGKLQGSPSIVAAHWFDGLSVEPLMLPWSHQKHLMMLVGEGSGGVPLISPLLPPGPQAPALVFRGYPAVPLWQTTSPQTWSARIGDILSKVQQGKQNITLLITLNANATSTTIIDPRISATSALTFTPLTADAAAILSSVYLSEQQSGQAILTHASTANTDCTFTMVISG